DDRKHYRYAAGQLQQRAHGQAAMRQDDLWRESGQFSRVSTNFGGIVGRPARVDPHVAADGPAQDRKPLLESPDPGLKYRIVRRCGQQHADPPHSLLLLRARRERPCHRAAEERDELAPPNHSITSLASASSVGGTSMPIVLAVCKLMTNSNLVGCITGKSAGFSPLRMRPV